MALIDTQGGKRPAKLPHCNRRNRRLPPLSGPVKIDAICWELPFVLSGSMAAIEPHSVWPNRDDEVRKAARQLLTQSTSRVSEMACRAGRFPLDAPSLIRSRIDV